MIEAISTFQEVLDSDGCLVAVTKYQSLEDTIQVIQNGVRDIGESRVETIQEKYIHLPDETRVHFIGPIQSRKIPQIVQYSHTIQSLCSQKHARMIHTSAKEQGKIQQVLIQLNLTNEPQKIGISFDEFASFLSYVQSLRNIECIGVMCMGKSGDTEVTRKAFLQLKDIQETHMLPYCSMGMSGDWKIAIEAGSNMLRIGSGIFD